jgi:hypothetical protein
LSAARQSKITLTGTRIPAITAWPCITPGSVEIISSWSAVTSSVPCRKEERAIIAGRAASDLEPVRDPRGSLALSDWAAEASEGCHVTVGMQSKDAVTVVSGGWHTISSQIRRG